MQMKRQLTLQHLVWSGPGIVLDFYMRDRYLFLQIHVSQRRADHCVFRVMFGEAQRTNERITRYAVLVSFHSLRHMLQTAAKFSIAGRTCIFLRGNSQK